MLSEKAGPARDDRQLGWSLCKDWEGGKVVSFNHQWDVIWIPGFYDVLLNH